jgi:hypothetical protein
MDHEDIQAIDRIYLRNYLKMLVELFLINLDLYNENLIFVFEK